MPEHEFHVPEPEPEPEATPINPLYERQATFGLSTPSVILIGAGGVGCWTALSLVLGGVEDITIFDGDQVSLNNLNRLPLPEAMIGELKSVALAHWLESLRPKARIIARGMFDSTILLDPNRNRNIANWVVCCTDSLKNRRECYQYSQDIGANYLELGADGERWTLSPAPPEFSTENEDAPGYATVPVHVGPCMMAGAAACYYILHNIRPIVSHSVNWIKGPIIRAFPDLGALKFETMSEVDLSWQTKGKEWFICPDCSVEIAQDLILIIKHHREHYPTLGLVEAKNWAMHQLEQLRAREPEVDEGPQTTMRAEVGDWTEDEVASHDEWAATEEGQAILNAVEPVAEAIRRVEINGQEQQEE